ncbi:Chymotrypsin-C precursor-like protein, partial [Leptotrombidium deliense]
MNTIIYFFASIILTAFANDDNNKFECGIANKETIKARIIGGTEVSNNKYPWMVAVLKKSQSNDWRCGGSLISENAIITAAHCVYDTKAEDIEVLIGTNDIDSTDTDNRKNVKQ